MAENKTILVTGGSGFIGTLVCKELVKSNYNVINIDRVKKKIDNVTQFPFDLSDHQINGVLKVTRPDAIIHLAAEREVERSMSEPGTYYWNNVANTISLLNHAAEAGVKDFVFSSSSSVYGNRRHNKGGWLSDSYTPSPFTEDELPNPLSPYAKSKRMVEEMLDDYKDAYGINYVSLRYFNASGASLDLTHGYTQVPPTTLIPSIAKHIVKGSELIVYGKDYPYSPDQTAVRDYTHVVDIAESHLLALDFLEANQTSEIINIGAGAGHSVLQVIQKFEKLTGEKVNPVFVDRRTGDVDYTFADNQKAKNLLGWSPKYTLDDIIRDSYNWELKQK